MAKVRVVCGTDRNGEQFVICGGVIGFPSDSGIEKHGCNPSKAEEAKSYAESIANKINECCGEFGPLGLMLGLLPFHIFKKGQIDEAIASCAEVVTFDGDVDVGGWEEVEGYIKGAFDYEEDCQHTEL